MTSEQAIKSLSPAQRRIFERLQAKTDDPNGFYLTRIERRSAAVLERMGWITHSGLAVWCRYRLTDLGKLIAGPIAFTPGNPGSTQQETPSQTAASGCGQIKGSVT